MTRDGDVRSRARLRCGCAAAADQPPRNHHPPPAPAVRDVESVVGDCALYLPAGPTRRAGAPARRCRSAPASPTGSSGSGCSSRRREEVQTVAAEFGLPPLAVEDAIDAHQRPKLEVYGDVRLRGAQAGPLRRPRRGRRRQRDRRSSSDPTSSVTVRHGRSDVLAPGPRRAGRAGPDVLLSTVRRRCCTAPPTSWSTATRTATAAINDDVDEIEAPGVRRRRARPRRAHLQAQARDRRVPPGGRAAGRAAAAARRRRRAGHRPRTRRRTSGTCTTTCCARSTRSRRTTGC